MGPKYIALSIAAGVALLIGVVALTTSYRPNVAFNRAAQKGECEVTVQIQKNICDINGVSQTCYDGYVVTHLVNQICGWTVSTGTFNSEEAARDWSSRFTRRPYPCYYDPSRVCEPSDHIKDTRGPLVAGIVFLTLGIGLAFIVIIMWSITWYKHQQYEAV